MTAEIRVLLVEDDESYGIVVQHFLQIPRKSQDDIEFHLEQVTELAAAMDRLRRERFDVVLLDLTLPDAQGIGGVSQIQEACPDIPIVVLTECEESLAVETLREGAQDYLIKHKATDRDTIARSIRYAVERSRMRSGLVEYARALDRQMQLLEHGFAKLSAGDFSVRIAADSATSGHGELSKVMLQFDHTVEQLEKLNALKSQFYSTVAHDLRSPLNTIVLSATTLASFEELDEKRARLVEIIRRRATHLMAVVNSVLDIFAAESNQFYLRCHTVDIAELARKTVGELGWQATTRGQKLLFALELEDPLLYCDNNRVSRVLENLVCNAIKYCPEGATIRVHVSGDAASVRFAVEDDGPGIAAGDQSHIFEPFYRGEGQANCSGSGLGLAICKQFVEAHGGTLTVESAPGHGARFTVTIPRVAAPQLAQATSEDDSVQHDSGRGLVAAPDERIVIG